jgi:hypothetical protein
VIDEAAARDRMRLLADAGDYAGAPAEYAGLELRLAAELSVKPERETRRLFDELRRHAPPPLGAGRLRLVELEGDHIDAERAELHDGEENARGARCAPARRGPMAPSSCPACRSDRVTGGQEPDRELLPVDAPAAFLGLRPLLFVIQATSLAARRRLGLGARARDVQRVSQPLGEPLQGELAVARLRARVLRHRGHARPQFRAYAGFLCLG